MKKILYFIKKETVLSIAVVLVVISVFFVVPDREYISYIDFRTLAILFCLMSIVAGLRNRTAVSKGAWDRRSNGNPCMLVFLYVDVYNK